MSRLRKALKEYLAVRRAFGFKLRLAGSLLHKFVSFAEQEGACVITTELALRWATQPEGAQPAQWANRLAMVRHFAQYRRAADPRTEVPLQGLLPYAFRRKKPYIYSEDEIARILGAARRLPSWKGLRAATYSTLFGLMAVTGMRVSEPIALDREDVDLSRGILVVRKTKFNKSRLVPVHVTTREALRRYARLRDRICPQPETPSFFISEEGTRLTENVVQKTFVKVSRKIGLRGPQDSHGPRLHDFRHGFAVRTLLQWYRTGANVERHMPELSAYLGHAHVNDTYWYLSATPELLQLAMRRFHATGGRSL
jgi:integrase